MLLSFVTGNVFSDIVISLRCIMKEVFEVYHEIAVIQKFYDCMFVHLPEYLLLKPFNKCEHTGFI